MASLQSHFIRASLFLMRPIADFSLPAPQLRRRIEAGAWLMQTPGGVTVHAVRVGGVPAEWLAPAGAPDDRVLLYIHGGGFVIGSCNTHRPLAARLALASGSRALQIEYRLAPEHRFPDALDDVCAAYRALLHDGIPARGIVVAGDSAGGNLALALLVALRDAGEPLPAGAVCLSPVTDLAGTGASMRTKAASDPVLSPTLAVDLTAAYAGDHDPREPLISPLYADLRGLPPVLLHVGSDEILLDDSTRFAERARAAGVDTQLVVWPGLWHVFQVYAQALPEALQSIEQIGAFVRARQSAPA
jgi:monoterpene epsilon-lactone hydrolase